MRVSVRARLMSQANTVDLVSSPESSTGSASHRRAVLRARNDGWASLGARALRDAGMEVIYTGLHRTPEQIVQTVIEEDADAVGLSVLSGAHMTLFARLMQLLQERGVADVVVFGGGIIPDADIPELEAM